MTHTMTRRRAILSLIAALAAPTLAGCGGGGNDVSVLPDQGQIRLQGRKSGDRKPQKGMDRDGS